MSTLLEFAAFCKKVNFNRHIPTDLEIRTYMARNSMDLPHMDVSMIECLEGSGTITSKLTNKMLEMLNPEQKLILKTLNAENKGFRIKKGEWRILPHPFYWQEKDVGCEKFSLRVRASTEL